MKKLINLFGFTVLLVLFSLPASACFGCSGRFPPGVNLRLLKMRLQNDASSYPEVTPIPRSDGEAIPFSAPIKQNNTKASKGKKVKIDGSKPKKR